MKTFLHILLIFIIGGCNPLLPDTGPIRVEGHPVSITFPAASSRSFTDSIAETWEKKMNTATIYIFNPSGKTIYTYTLNSTDLNAINNTTNKSLNFIIPGNLPSCDIYFVANTPPSAPVTTKTSFLTSFEQDISTYNGTFAKVSTSANRSNGFVMTGSADGVALSSTQTTNVSITLRRIVAKVAMVFNFTTVANLGSITINSVILTLSAPHSNLFPLVNANTGGTAITLQQTPQVDATNSKQFRALFYIYENDARSTNLININISGSGSVLIINTPFNYNFKLNGDKVNNATTGKISRNKMYYVTVNITRLLNILVYKPNHHEINIREVDSDSPEIFPF